MLNKDIVKLLRRGMLSDTLLQMAADTIEEMESENKHQQAEIERLEEIRKADNKLITSLNKCYETAKSEAVKEFAERLKKSLFYKCGDMNYTETCDVRRLIDNIVKEMVGESNG